MNKELLTKLRPKKKNPQHIRSGNTVKSHRMSTESMSKHAGMVRKTQIHLQLNLARHMKNYKKGATSI